jgi:hypothetical protein
MTKFTLHTVPFPRANLSSENFVKVPRLR